MAVKINKSIRCDVCGMPYDFEQYDECPYCQMPDDWAEQFDYLTDSPLTNG